MVEDSGTQTEDPGTGLCGLWDASTPVLLLRCPGNESTHSMYGVSRHAPPPELLLGLLRECCLIWLCHATLVEDSETRVEDSRTQKDSGTILFIGDYLMVGNRRDYLVNGRVSMNVKIPILHDKM